MNYWWQNQRIGIYSQEWQISQGIRPVWPSVFAVRMKKAWVLSYPLSAQQRLWSDLAYGQADLSLRWAHIHSVGFACVKKMIFTFRVFFFFFFFFFFLGGGAGWEVRWGYMFSFFMTSMAKRRETTHFYVCIRHLQIMEGKEERTQN